MRETVERLDVLGESGTDQPLDAGLVDGGGAGTADVTLPDGVAASGSGTESLKVTTEADAGFGDLVETDASTVQEDIDVPRQPGPDRVDDALAHDASTSASRAAELPVVETTEPTSEPAAEQEVARPDKSVAETQRAKPEIALDIRGNGPFHEMLLNEGDAGAALVPYLHRLAVTKNDYCDRSQAQIQDDGDELEKGLLDRLGDDNGARENSEAWQLKDILVRSLWELQGRPELIEDGEVNWLGLGTALLDQAAALGKGPDFEVRRSILSGAAVAALMSENPDDRITFLEQTAERNLSQPMASALDHSEVSIILPGYRDADVRPHAGRTDRSIQRLRSFHPSFQANADDITRYRQLTERDLDESIDAHAVMREVTEGSMTADGVIDGEHADALEEVSVAPKYVDKYRIDPTKAERFALEEMFVQDQMAELFPNGDTTSFRRQLRERQQLLSPRIRAVESVDAQLVRLFSDTRMVIHNMSEPVVERYSIANPSTLPTDTWKREELVAWRYRQLHGNAKAYDGLAKFVDPTISGRSSNFSDEVYDIAEHGAALSGTAAEALYNVTQLANTYRSTTGDTITPKELLDVAQANRRQLMKLAAINIDHFTASLMSESMGGALEPGSKRPAALDEAAIVRKPSGKLDLTGPLFKTEIASSQTAVRLACVALRVNVEGGREAVEAGARNNTLNSIELLTKLVFDEAYNRGVFRAVLARPPRQRVVL